MRYSMEQEEMEERIHYVQVWMELLQETIQGQEVKVVVQHQAVKHQEARVARVSW